METNEIKNVLTKFFYKSDDLYYQILVLDTASMSYGVYAEFGEFDDYRKALENLEGNQFDWTPLRLVQDKTFKSEPAFAKVA